MEERQERRDARHKKIEETYQAFLAAKASSESQDAAEPESDDVATLRKQLEELGIRSSSVDNKDGKIEEEEDESELTADELARPD